MEEGQMIELEAVRRLLVEFGSSASPVEAMVPMGQVAFVPATFKDAQSRIFVPIESGHRLATASDAAKHIKGLLSVSDHRQVEGGPGEQDRDGSEPLEIREEWTAADEDIY